MTSRIEVGPRSVSPAEGVAAAIGDGKKHLLLAASGSVATLKIPSMIRALGNHAHLSIRIILTKSAAHFLAGQSAEQPTLREIAAYPNVDGVYQDDDEWSEPWTRGRPILHIELRRWVHLLVIAPMSANLLAKVACGLCDNLLTSIIRAWDVQAEDEQAAKIVVAPSMNDRMYAHPLTAAHLAVLAGWNWFEILAPQVKLLACGDLGLGGMHEWTVIVQVIEQKLVLHGRPTPPHTSTLI